MKNLVDWSVTWPRFSEAATENMLPAQQIIQLHDEANHLWHLDQPSSNVSIPLDLDADEPLAQLVLSQHRANFDLWHEEDKARDPGVTDAGIARVKHAIDRLNQQRNDRVEQIDVRLLTEAGEQNPEAPLNSETPGLMIDRLSILALKIYHTREESVRSSATEAHRQRNLERLALLEQQRGDLAGCLDALWSEVQRGLRRFKLYRQLKMYNDPDLNPAVYGRMVSPSGS